MVLSFLWRTLSLHFKQELVAPELAEENGIKLTDDDNNKTIDDQIAKAKANYDSDEAYLNDIKSAYLTEDLYRKMLETATIYTKVNDTLLRITVSMQLKRGL